MKTIMNTKTRKSVAEAKIETPLFHEYHIYADQVVL